MKKTFVIVLFVITSTFTCFCEEFNTSIFVKNSSDSTIMDYVHNNRELLSVACGEYRETFLMAAVSQSRYELTKTLLEKGADQKIQSTGGGTPLLHAAEVGNYKIVKLLLGFGANPTLRNNGHLLPLTGVLFALNPVIPEYFENAIKVIELLIPVTILEDDDFDQMERWISVEKDPNLKVEKTKLLELIKARYRP